jgi:CDP-diacylglycerol---serine O-phosphatidyltransferase
VLGLTESVFFRRRLEAARLPPQVRAEIEADEALEADDEDVEAKDEGDEYI